MAAVGAPHTEVEHRRCSTSRYAREEGHIVHFADYDSVDALAARVAGALSTVDAGSARQPWFCFGRRPSVAAAHPTDFAVVLLPARDASLRARALRALRAADGVQSVGPDRPVRARSSSGATSRGLLGADARRHSRGPSTDGVAAAERLLAPSLWHRNHTGQGVRIAVFDSGLSAAARARLRHVESVTNWTDEPDAEDRLGHGSTVASLLAGTHAECPGVAPDATLLVYKVFNAQQESRTSWFLDAFNHALGARVQLLNLSVGGPDFLDGLFVGKVRELAARGILVVSGAGNRGPLAGSLLNPADQDEVLGVGALGADEGAARAAAGLPPPVAPFSARGPTAWEPPLGAARFKPDVLAPGFRVLAAGADGTCAPNTGTSFACPIATGAGALLVGASRSADWFNPASLKLLLMRTADELPDASLAEQGAGAISLLGALGALRADEAERARERLTLPAVRAPRAASRPQPSFWPPELDLTRCPRMWPHCEWPLYARAQPRVLNVTLFDPRCARSRIVGTPRFVSSGAGGGPSDALRVRFALPPGGVLWPWSGWLGLILTVSDEHASGVLRGNITVELSGCEPLDAGLGAAAAARAPADASASVLVSAPLAVRVQPTPPRTRRVLLDAWHSLRYPPGFIPRDDLAAPAVEIFDASGGDLPSTNLATLSSALAAAGFSVEVLACDLTCFDAREYGALVLFDPEDAYTDAEAAKLRADVLVHGLSLVVVADWYDARAMRALAFHDTTSDAWWAPATGGANLPALNALLAPLGVAFVEGSYRGALHAGGRSAFLASGAAIGRFPAHGQVLSARLADEGAELAASAEAHTSALDVLMHAAASRGGAGAWEGGPTPSTVPVVPLGLAQFGALSAAPPAGATAAAQLPSSINVSSGRHLASVSSESAAPVAAGRLAVFGDSSCMDDTYAATRELAASLAGAERWPSDGGHAADTGECIWLMRELVAYACEGTQPPSLADALVTLRSPLVSRAPLARLDPAALARPGANQTGTPTIGRVARSRGGPVPAHRSGGGLRSRLGDALLRSRAQSKGEPAGRQPMCPSHAGLACPLARDGLLRCTREADDAAASKLAHVTPVVFAPPTLAGLGAAVAANDALAAVAEPVPQADLVPAALSSFEHDALSFPSAAHAPRGPARTPDILGSSFELLALPLVLLTAVGSLAATLLYAHARGGIRRSQRRARQAGKQAAAMTRVGIRESSHAEAATTV